MNHSWISVSPTALRLVGGRARSARAATTLSGLLATGEEYDYLAYHFKPSPDDTEYKRHYVIRPNNTDGFYYYYNPESKKYWGRFVAKGSDAGKYSELKTEDRRETLAEIPAEAFEKPGPMPTIPGATDQAVMLPPTDFLVEDPKDGLPKLGTRFRGRANEDVIHLLNRQVPVDVVRPADHRGGKDQDRRQGPVQIDRDSVEGAR